MSTSERETLAAAGAAAAGAEAAPESSDYVLTADTARILVVDDEKVIREILADFLSMEGYVVQAVEDGAAAMDELKKRAELVPTFLIIHSTIPAPRDRP